MKGEGKKRKPTDAPAREEAPIFVTFGERQKEPRDACRVPLRFRHKKSLRIAPKGVADYNQHANFSANLTSNAL